jgi:predicted porin
MQNKKALVLAVGAALAMQCAFAQKSGGKDKEADPDSIVELYGKVYPEIVRQKGKDATPAGTPVATFAAAPTGTSSIISRNEMESSNSRFGIRGSEKLGGGLKAIFQLETEFHVDSNDSRYAQRDSFVGLAHNRFGTVKLGRMDTPFKEYGDDISFLGVSSGNFTSTSAVMRRFGFGTSNAARFHERRVNVVQYESPQIGGLDFKAQYSTDEIDTAARKPHVWSMGAKYDFGNLEIMAGHEIHYDQFGGSNNVPTAMRNLNDPASRSRDRATEVAVTYKLGKHQFELDYEWHEWTESDMLATAAGRFKSYKNNSWLAVWDARWSQQWRTQVHYVKATAGECVRTLGAACITDGLDGTQISAGVAYYFSRRTYLFFMAQWLKNGKSAIFASGTQVPSVGEDVTQYAVGIQHTF